MKHFAVADVAQGTLQNKLLNDEQGLCVVNVFQHTPCGPSSGHLTGMTCVYSKCK